MLLSNWLAAPNGTERRSEGQEGRTRMGNGALGQSSRRTEHVNYEDKRRTNSDWPVAFWVKESKPNLENQYACQGWGT